LTREDHGCRRAGRARLLLPVLLAWPHCARAYRPFDSTDAAVAGRGEVELELGPAGLLREGAGRALVAPSLTMNWGFADRWEAVIEGLRLVPLAGGAPGPLVESAISLKAVLREGSLQGGHGPSLATEAGLLLPDVPGPGGAGASWAAIASQRWEALTVHAEGGATWTRSHAPGLSGGLVVEGPGAWRVRPVAEALVERERGAPAARSVLAGAIWRAREDLSVDAALRLARADGTATTEVRAGLTWTLGAGSPPGGRAR
jgi:hypothetical protein